MELDLVAFRCGAAVPSFGYVSQPIEPAI